MVLTDHKAIISALKTNRGNKSHQSRLTRWADRLLRLISMFSTFPDVNWV